MFVVAAGKFTGYGDVVAGNNSFINSRPYPGLDGAFIFVVVGGVDEPIAHRERGLSGLCTALSPQSVRAKSQRREGVSVGG